MASSKSGSKGASKGASKAAAKGASKAAAKKSGTSGARTRSAISGRFVTKETGARHPRTTVKETVKSKPGSSRAGSPLPGKPTTPPRPPKTR